MTSLTGLWTTVLKHLGCHHFGFVKPYVKVNGSSDFKSEGTKHAQIVASCQSQDSVQ